LILIGPNIIKESTQTTKIKHTIGGGDGQQQWIYNFEIRKE
jgi:hypothetical protein